MAELPGGKRANEIVVVGAHYDTVSTTPGADDNASAVAVMIEVARLMRRTAARPHGSVCGIRLRGTAALSTRARWAARFTRASVARRANECAACCVWKWSGYYSTAPHSQRIPPGIPRIFHPLLPRRGDFLAAVGNLHSWRLLWRFRRGFKRAVRFPLLSLALPESISEIRLSDNSSFWDQGYPALMLTDTSFLRNPHYHLGERYAGDAGL